MDQLAFSYAGKNVYGWTRPDMEAAQRVGLIPATGDVEDWMKRMAPFETFEQVRCMHPIRSWLIVDNDVVVWAKDRIDAEQYLMRQARGFKWQVYTFHGDRAKALSFSVRRLKKSKLLNWTYMRRYESWLLIRATLPAYVPFTLGRARWSATRE